MVSAACLAGQQTILVCFFPRNVGLQEKKRDKLIENYKRKWMLSSTDTPLTFCQ